jgi:hypothetical protein
MPTGLQPIREALDGRFSVDNLRLIDRLCFEALGAGPLRHAAVILAIAHIASRIADAWDERPIDSSVADRVEQAVNPCLKELLSAVDADSETTCAVLDKAANAFMAQVTLGLDSDIDR